MYLEAKPGTNGTAQVRFRPALAVEEMDADTGATALPEAGWFPDPGGAAGLRFGGIRAGRIG